MKEDINFFPSKESFYFKKIKSKKELENSSFEEEGYLLDCSEFEARRILTFLKSKNQDKIIAFLGLDNQTNRRAIEKLKINYLVSPEKSPKKDSLKQRDSGLNHVLAKIAAKNKIAIIIDFNDLKDLKKEEKVKRIARIIQNINICKKNNCEIKIASFANNKEELIEPIQRKSFLESLGASTSQVKKSTGFS